MTRHGRFFILKGSVSFRDMTNTSNAPKIAALMSSYKRPADLVKQILTLLHQTYDCHIFVAVKGLSERDVNTCMQNTKNNRKIL